MHSVHVHDFKPQAYFWQTNWKNGNCFAKVWAKQTAYKPQCQLRNPRKVYANHFLCVTWRENQQIAHWRWLRRHWHGGRREDWQHQQWLLLDNPLTTRLSIILAWNRQCNMQINIIFAHFNCTQTGPELLESWCEWVRQHTVRNGLLNANRDSEAVWLVRFHNRNLFYCLGCGQGWVSWDSHWLSFGFGIKIVHKKSALDEFIRAQHCVQLFVGTSRSSEEHQRSCSERCTDTR